MAHGNNFSGQFLPNFDYLAGYLVLAQQLAIVSAFEFFLVDADFSTGVRLQVEWFQVLGECPEYAVGGFLVADWDFSPLCTHQQFFVVHVEYVDCGGGWPGLVVGWQLFFDVVVYDAPVYFWAAGAVWVEEIRENGEVFLGPLARAGEVGHQARVVLSFRSVEAAFTESQGSQLQVDAILFSYLDLLLVSLVAGVLFGFDGERAQAL